MQVFDVLLLTSEWLDDGDDHEIRIYGKSQKLGPVELIFDNQKPVFFVDREERLPAVDSDFERKELNLKTFRDRPVDGLYFNTYRDMQNTADRFKSTGVRAFETDVRPADRFLMERFIYSSAKVAGDYEQVDGLARFRNPKIKNGPSRPVLDVLSVDIETSMNGQLFSIGNHLTGGREEKIVFMVGDAREDLPENLSLYPSEKAVLEAWLQWFKDRDPDLIIGWYVVGFDLTFLERKCREYGIELDLSRTDRPILLQEKPGAGWFANISGRVVIDGIGAVRSAGYVFPNYKLDTVARELLDTGKLITSDGLNKVAEIERQFREDKPALARYNLEDCVLVTQLFEKIDLIPLIFKRCFFSGMMPDQLGIPNAPLDHYSLPKLHRMGYVAPNVPANPMDAHVPEDSAVTTDPGIYEHVAIIDFQNVLPSLIRIFKLDPLSLARAHQDPITLPNGRQVSGTEHILPELFERLMTRLDEALANGDTVTEKAVRLQLKNYRQVLHTQKNRFYQPVFLESLAHLENWLVAQARKCLEDDGREVVSADAEAIFVKLKPGEWVVPVKAGRRLAASLTNFFKETLEAKYGFAAVSTNFRAHFHKMILTSEQQKHGQLRRFAGRDAKGRLVQEGFEDVIKEWTEMAETFRDALLCQFLDNPKPDTWIVSFVDDLKSGSYDDKLSLTKRIRKKVEEYAKNAPPHIRAARMLKKPGRDVTYVFTQRGPVPVELEHKDIDYDHYISKQVKPVADSLLPLIGREFSKLSSPEQISLF